VGDGPLTRLQTVVGDEGAWPPWHIAATGAGPALVAAVTFAICDVDRPVVLGGLLAVAVAPWVIEATRRCVFDGPAALVTATAIAVLNLAGRPLGVIDLGGNHQTSLIILAFAVGETAAIRSMPVVVAVTSMAVATAIGTEFVDDPTYDYSSGPIWTAGMFIGLFSGLLIRRLLLAVGELKATQAALEATAATRERQRIAREVHDVIAHSMTVTMLHVTAARMAVRRGDSAGATEALEDAERLGRRSLADIRSTVGLLRAGDSGAPTAAALPVAEDLGELVDGYRGAGLPVETDLDIRLADLPAPLGLALYRIVQEALANVAKHARGADARVAVRVGDDAVTLEVDDDGGPTTPAAQPGHGLLGMRERTESLGGTFEAGPSATGWRVRATIPWGS